MSFDQTGLFRARTRLLETERGEKDQDDPKNSATSALSIRGRTIATRLGQLREAVMERRRASFDLSHHGLHGLLGGESRISERDLDRFETETSNELRDCALHIDNLKHAALRLQAPSSHIDHLQAICHLLVVFLKTVRRTLMELTAMRQHRKQHIKRMARLDTFCSIDHRRDDDDSDQKRRHVPSRSNEMGIRQRVVVKTDPPRPVPFDQEETVEENNLIPEVERAQLMEVNERFFDKVTALNREVNQIEGQVTEIARLQELFSEKVLEQERDIVRINDSAVDATENLRSGNEQIRRAIQNSASRRVILLFCLIVITFTLLFLDWYNP